MTLATQPPTLTPAEQRLLIKVWQMLSWKKYRFIKPSEQEIADALGVSQPSVNEVIRNLVEKGAGRREGRRGFVPTLRLGKPKSRRRKAA
jgi:Mn-dependent DtxR family transcriptional regulator